LVAEPAGEPGAKPTHLPDDDVLGYVREGHTMRKRIALVAVMAMAVGMLAMPASAYEIGELISKGEVQSALGFNNNQLQAAAAGKSLVASKTVEVTWTCSKTNPGQEDREIVQVRNATTTSYATAEARVRTQITGWIVVAAETNSDGPTFGTCPADQSGFVFDPDSVEYGEGSSVTFRFE
jgi:hypothetical protein